MKTRVYAQCLLIMIFGLLLCRSLHAQPTLFFPASQADAIRPSLPQSSKAQFESLINSSGYEDIAAFSTGNRYRKIGRAVGRLKMFAEDGRFATCTAWLIGDRYLLSNHHCIDVTDFPNNRIARVHIEMGVLSTATKFDIYAVRMPPRETSKDLDYAVLEVDPQASQKYGSFVLSSREPVDSEELFIIHHPLGQPQSLSRYIMYPKNWTGDEDRMLCQCARDEERGNADTAETVQR